jgi:hypothetical protein
MRPNVAKGGMKDSVCQQSATAGSYHPYGGDANTHVRRPLAAAEQRITGMNGGVDESGKK